jgi:hypothetical protein
MEKLLLLLLSLSLLLIGCGNDNLVMGKWTLVNKEKHEIHGNLNEYVDVSSIKKEDSLVYFWTLKDYSNPTRPGIFSRKILIELSCRAPVKMRRLSGTYYKGPMGTGEEFDIPSNVLIWEKWTYQQDNPTVEFVCNKAKFKF